MHLDSLFRSKITKELAAMNRASQDGAEARPVYFVSHTAEPGGGELALARYLTQCRLSPVALISGADGRVWDGIRDRGTPVFIAEPPGRLAGLYQLFYLGMAIRKISGGVIVANSMRTALLVALMKRRTTTFIYWVRDGLEEGSVSRAGAFITRLFTIRRVAYFLANSEWTAGTIRDLLPPAQIGVSASPCGIQDRRPADLATSGIVDAQGLGTYVDDESVVHLLYLGRIARWKGVHIAVQAVQLLNGVAGNKRYRLDIVGAALFGEEDYRSELVSLIADDDLIEMHGYDSNVPQLLRRYDGLLHCSILPEPFGQVVVQAMAAGLTVFASKHGGPTEIIDDGVDGFLVDPDNAASLATAIETVFSAPDVCHAVRYEAQKKSSRYSDSRTVDALDRYFDRIRKGLVA